MTPTSVRRAAPFLLAALAALAVLLSSAPSRAAPAALPAIAQLSQNSQPGWGKVYASASASGWFVALFSNGDLTPGHPGNADGSWEVFRWSNDGTLKQITDSLSERPPPIFTGTSAPAIGADGRRIAFASIQDLTPGRPGNADGSREIFLWDEAGGLRQITDHVNGDDANQLGSHQPWISGDGRRIVFASDMHGRQAGEGVYADAQTDIYLWTEGAGIRRLTSVASPQRRAWMPRLSQDGQHIAFYSNGDLAPGAPGNIDGNVEVFMWSDDGSFRQLTDHVGGRSMGIWAAPALSANGATVVFDADADLVPGAPGNLDGSTETFLWTAAGGMRQLTNLPQGKSARSPTVSGDGRTVAFVATGDLTPGQPGNSDGGQEMFLWQSGGAFSQLTRGASTGGIALPVLAADASLVTFLSDRDLATGNQVLTPQTFVIRLGAPSPPAALPTPTPAAPGMVPHVCPQLAGKVPMVVQQDALANPNKYYGWLMPLNPAVPAGPGNPLRTWLAVLAPGKPFSPGNPVVWKSGCP